tara:strand:- start:5553 stop:6827 length:1275 start_codon:yes stop_codon:yes gene_type:complete
VFYKSQIYWDGQKNNYYQIYYIISLTLIILSILTFYLNEMIKEYLIISLISALISFYIFEFYLTFKIVDSKEQRFQKQMTIKKKEFLDKTNQKFDVRSRYEIFADLRKQDPKIQVSYHQNLLIKKNDIFPFGGISNSKTIHCNENGYYSIYESDRYGFNNPDKEWDQENLEFLIVGDSHAHGACVNRPHDIASVLRNLSNKSVLNLGYSGWGSLIKYAILREYLIPNVNNILWVYFEGNDLDDLKNELGSDLLIEYYKNLNFSQNLKKRQTEIDNIASAAILKEVKQAQGNKINFDMKKFIKMNLVRQKITTSFLIKKKQKKKLPITEFKKILSLVKELAKKNGSNLYFVYFPEYSRYKNNYDNSNYILIKKIVDELNISFIDINKKVFEKEREPLNLFPFGLFGHYNQNGYRKIAEAIYNSIQ